MLKQLRNPEKKSEHNAKFNNEIILKDAYDFICYSFTF